MSSTAWVITVGYAVLTITPLPLIALALWHHSLAPILAFGLLLGFAAASFAVGVAFVNGWYPPERREFPHEHFKSRGTWPEAQRTAEPLSDRGPRRVVVRCDALEDGVGCSHQGHSPLLRIASPVPPPGSRPRRPHE